MQQTMDVQMENRIQWGRLVVWSIDTHLEDIVSTLDGLAGMDRIEWRELFEELRDELAAATAHLDYAHEQLAECRAAADTQQHSLEVTTEHLHVYMMKIRDVLDQQGLLHFGLRGALPLEAEQLAERAQHAAGALRSVHDELRDDTDVEQLAHELEICEKKLSEELDRTRQKALPVQAMMSARAQAQALWTLAYRRVGGIFQHALTLANCPAAAALVRPTLLRTSGKAPLPSSQLLREGIRAFPVPDEPRPRV